MTSMPLVLRAAVKLAFGLVGFVGLPLLGWGVDDLDGFFRNPARATYVAVVALLQHASRFHQNGLNSLTPRPPPARFAANRQTSVARRRHPG